MPLKSIVQCVAFFQWNWNETINQNSKMLERLVELHAKEEHDFGHISIICTVYKILPCEGVSQAATSMFEITARTPWRSLNLFTFALRSARVHAMPRGPLVQPTTWQLCRQTDWVSVLHWGFWYGPCSHVYPGCSCYSDCSCHFHPSPRYTFGAGQQLRAELLATDITFSLLPVCPHFSRPAISLGLPTPTHSLWFDLCAMSLLPAQQDTGGSHGIQGHTAWQ